jgi:hypothetical protein
MAYDGQSIRAQGLKTGILELGHHQCAISDQYDTVLFFWDFVLNMAQTTGSSVELESRGNKEIGTKNRYEIWFRSNT